MDNVQEVYYFNNTLSSQTFRCIEGRNKKERKKGTKEEGK
jgi:hypothetical protein